MYIYILLSHAVLLKVQEQYIIIFVQKMYI